MGKARFCLKGVAFLFSMLFVLTSFLALPSSAKPSLPNVTGVSAAYLYNYESDRILLQQNLKNRIVPASTAKITAGLLALQKLEHRQEETVTVTKDMLYGVQGYTINLKPDTTLKIRDLLYGLICGGGNDAANALAILSCGSIDGFVAEMNILAKSLGCTQTNYTNPTGIDDPAMYTTLEDVIIISKKAVEHATFLEMCSAVNYAYTPRGAEDSVVFYNRNAQISTFSGAGYQNRYVKGLNAGATDRGGYCVVSYATNGEERYLCIIMGAAETPMGILSYYHSNNLLNHLFKRYSYLQIAEKEQEVCTVPVQYALPKGGEKEVSVPCVLTQDLYGFIPADTDLKKGLSYRFYFHEDPISAPVEAGRVIGGVDIYLGDEWITGCPIAAAEPIEHSSLLVFLARMKNNILSRRTLLILLFLVPMLVLYLYFTSRRHRHNTIKTISDIGRDPK